jgi:hypothetical protein
LNIVTAVARELKSHSSVTSLATVAKHLVPGDVDGTGLVKVAVQVMGSWYATPQSARFPRLRIVIAADASRVVGLKTSENAHDRALEVYRAVDEILHRETREAVVWGGSAGVMVLGSNRAAEPSFVERPEQAGSFLTCSYNLKIV